MSRAINLVFILLVAACLSALAAPVVRNEGELPRRSVEQAQLSEWVSGVREST